MIQCTTDDQLSQLESAIDIGVIVMYACLGFAFLVCGITMNVALKRNFPLFYETHCCSLWVATICLSFPLLLRAVINVIYIESAAFKHFFLKRYIIANNTFLVVSTYIPIFTSMFSLVFGYLRKRQEQMRSNLIKFKKPNMYGGSGELEENKLEWDNKSYSSYGTASDLQSYLDPPIENYRVIYQHKNKSSNASRADSQPVAGNQFSMKQS